MAGSPTSMGSRPPYTVASNWRLAFGDSLTSYLIVGRQVLAKLFVTPRAMRKHCEQDLRKLWRTGAEDSAKRKTPLRFCRLSGRIGGLVLATL
eukprot:6490968-Amphidinium_carterae.2